MKIALIQPVPEKINPEYIHEPLNLGYLASYLQKKGFNDVSIIVGAFEENDENIIKKAEDADIIGFTATSPMVAHALRLAKKLKGNERIIVMGGPHASSEPEHLLITGLVDIVVKGEGEIVLAELVSHIDKRKDWRKIKGLSFIDGDTIVHNEREALIEDIDTVPFPARELFDQKRFMDISHKRYNDRSIWMLSSRGCPFRCTYCASNEVWTRKWRARSPGNIVEEILLLINEFDTDRINFADDTFTVSKKRLNEFSNLLIKKNINISWGCNVRVDTVDKALLQLMKEAGCKDIWIGAESGSPKILKNIKKDIDLKKVRDVFGWAKDVGLIRRGYFMIGSPGETVDDIKETEKLVEEIKPDSLSFSIFTPYPGCEAYRQGNDRGVNYDNIDWSRVDLLKTVISDTDTMRAEEIESEHRRLCDKFKDLWKK